MPLSTMFVLDLVAISVLTFVLYFPRHRRKDMVVAFLGINVGVLGVTQALASAGVSAGLGLGLFGVLSIIRLRSAEMDQEEVSYYFAGLALGLLGGITVTPGWLTPLLMTAVVGVIFVGDHPALFGSYRNQLVNLDAAYTDEGELRARLEELLDAKVHRVHVRKIDLVNDTTYVEVRFQQIGEGRADDNPYATAELGARR
jgi:hypothetical protein